MDEIDFRPAQRRTLLIWSGAGALLFLTGVVGVAVSPLVPGHLPAFLMLPGLVGLLLAPLTLNTASSRTVLTERGIRTGSIVSRHACSWSDVATIGTTRVQGRSAYSTRVLIRLTSGKSFMLAAPFDSTNGRDREFLSKVGRIESYWYARRSSGS